MPSVRTAIEFLKHLESKGRGDEVVHVVLVAEEARKRKENSGPQPKTRFQVETDDPVVYSALNEEKDRIIKHVKNKSVALTIIIWWLRRLNQQVLDKVLADSEDPR